MGADVVVYSATKHIDGQGRTLGGAVLGSAEFVDGPVQTLMRHTGPSLSPFNAWVLTKGLETLSMRVERQTAAALRIAGWLEQHPRVRSVRYPFLDSHPQAEPGPPADARRRHGRDHGARRRQARGVRAARRPALRRHLEQPRRQQVDGHPPGHHDAPPARTGGPRGGRHHRRRRAAVGRARGRRRPGRRPRPGARRDLTRGPVDERQRSSEPPGGPMQSG
nr:PLP-dependent transferase [Angustibacter aerolatus]